MTPVDPTPPASGRPRDDARDEHITATGWRVKGAAIPLVEEAARSVPLAAARPADGLAAVKVRLRPRLTRDRVVPIALHAITEAVRTHWPDAPPLLDDAPLSRPAERLHALRWEIRGSAGAWTGELRWRHPHPTARNVPCLTHVVLQEHAGLVTLAARVSAEGGLGAVRGAVGAGQAMPPFLRALRHRVRITVDEYDTAPHVLDDARIDVFVREVLLSERRAVPAFVLAPQEAGDYLVEPELLADELVGLGPLYVLDRHPTTFRLTDSLGDRRLSCFFGALRVYLPGFTCADEPTHHPLMLRDRLIDPIERLALVGQLAQRAARESTLPAGVMEEAEVTPSRAFAAAAATSGTARRGTGASSSSAAVSSTPLAQGALDASGASASGSDATSSRDATSAPTEAPTSATVPVEALVRALDGVSTRLEALTRVVEQLLEQQRVSRDELARVRTSAAVRAASTASIERRFEALESLLRGVVGADASAPVDTEEHEPSAPDDDATAQAHDDEEDPRPTLRDVLQQAAASHGDALLVLEAADRAAAESPYEDVDRVALVLDAMATLAQRRMEGGLGVTLREAFREHGIDYRSSISSGTAERLRKQYRVQGDGGVVYDCREHLVLGTSYDPRYCLRIYFTSRHPGESRFVIGHVGRHFDVKTTT